MYIDEFGRPVSPSMASQYSPPHEHMVPSWPLPPPLPIPSTTAPMSPSYTYQAGAVPQSITGPQYMPQPNFFPVYLGHSGHMGPPPPTMGSDGPSMGVQPGMWYHPPEGAVIPPFVQVSCPCRYLVAEADSTASRPECRLRSDLPYPPCPATGICHCRSNQ